MTEPILQVRDLVTHFTTERGVVRAVGGVTFDVRAGETLALVGESGSGKSVTAMSLMRIVRPPGRIASGEVTYHGRNLLKLSDSDMREVRGAGISMIFQDPMSSLNPVMRVRDQLVEAMLAHGKFTGAQARSRALELMERVGIPDPDAKLADYPHAFSGGMRQRVVIAMALANEPDIIIADEPSPDPRAAGAGQPGPGHGDRAHHPQPRRGGALLPAGGGDVRRPDR
jgi:peptide/nickel transport system ATP-binding protein